MKIIINILKWGAWIILILEIFFGILLHSSSHRVPIDTNYSVIRDIILLLILLLALYIAEGRIKAK